MEHECSLQTNIQKMGRENDNLRSKIKEACADSLSMNKEIKELSKTREALEKELCKVRGYTRTSCKNMPCEWMKLLIIRRKSSSSRLNEKRNSPWLGWR